MATATASTIEQFASTIVSSTESKRHLLMIDGYSRIKDATTTGTCIWSRNFYVGGHGWYIGYYPNGHSGFPNYISVDLLLASHVAEVRAELTFSLLNQAGEPVPSYTYRFGVQNFRNYRWQGPWLLIQKTVLERSEHLRDNCFSIRCDLTVIKPPVAKDIDIARLTPPPSSVVSVPPSELNCHIGSLLATGDGADVTFEVNGKMFMAHRIVLAARSPVFRAELFGSAEKKNNAAADGADAIIHVEDMEAQDFEALLHFIYTDLLPDMKGGGDAVAMLPDLVAAANRYKMERLRLVCEDKLCEYVNVRTVAAMLAFAGEHHCHGLKKKCLWLLDDPANLREIVETEGLEHLTKSYPLVLKDLITKFATKP
ncbi:hypothetical protein E2562_023158 [Oryza meyeriana var. granulata]|uniref:BTB domain-containing protein n=1 Tax=Oryza meyeriana var. granulata TaxID=110450 RepID=A0A6G1BZI9_9ORYZ|nr:hypothetical protein E2562_023158 [Oryza meyeriana var. granulata]